MASDLLSMFVAVAESTPERVALVYLADGENESQVLTFEQLAQEVRRYAGGILQHARPGDRALLLLRPGPSYVASFLGCLWAGVVAVPAYPERGSRHGERLAALVAGARPSLILVDETPPEGGAERDARVLEVRRLATSPDAAGDRRRVGETDVAFLQYTSGSTSAPRGVAITHGNLMHNEAAIRRRFRARPSEYSVTWLPPYHDMGLIGSLLQPLAGGMSTVMMPPTAFLQRPSRWLRAISRYGARYSGGPTFAYALCANLVHDADLEDVDLSSWEVAYVGAERVSAPALRAFGARFASHGFRASAFAASYGLAEATLMVTSAARSGDVRSLQASVRALERGELAPGVDGEKVREVVACGEPADGVELRIVAPETGRDCAEGAVGEIWVRGPSVASGYFENDAATREVFGGRLPGDEGPFLRTGDLGTLREGQLYVTGRSKDLLIVDGRNVSPEDLEATASVCDPALSPGGSVAFACEAEDREAVVLAVEVRREFQRRVVPAELMAKIRSVIATEHGVGLRDVVLVRARSLPRTSSGKLRRGAARDAYVAGALARVETSEAPAETPPVALGEEPLLALVVRLLSEQLGRPGAELDPSWSFASLGLDSRGAVVLSGLLSRSLSRDLPPTLCFEHPTPSKLAHFLAGARAPATEGTARRTETLAEPARDAVAIVGVAFRLPGASSVDELLELLRRGGDAVRDARPNGRPDANLPGPGGFLDDPSLFDAEHFGLLPREAERTDPQQRLVLEVAWEALEAAAIAPDSLAGRSVGVFLGISGFDYSRGREPTPHGATGNALSIAANRLSYFLDLRGPSLSVDTACSSSLVAVHLACQSLLRGESELALCGGVNLLLDGGPTAALAAAGMLSPTGRCRTFDAGADGYVRGEGCVVFVLKPLSAAVAAGDPVLAVLRGTAVSQDGRSNGLTAPNPAAQRAVVQEAWRDAGVTPADVGYVEAHGTGTALGDPIEVGALAELFAGHSASCRIGSIKSNVGHLEAAAGAAGLLKAVLSVKHAEIFPVAHLSAPNPALRLGNGLAIADRHGDWTGARRVAGVSSFGFGGTNAHAVVERAPDAPANAHEVGGPVLALLSARSEDRLNDLRERTASWLERLPDEDLHGACATLAVGRSQQRERVAFVVRTRAELIAKLRGRATSDDLCDSARQEFSGVRRLPFGPTTPFRRKRHWSFPARKAVGSREPEGRHPLLGPRIVGVPESGVWFQSSVSLESDPELFDHRAYQAVVVAGASQASLLLSAHRAAFGTLPARIESLSFPQGLIVRPGEVRTTQLRVEKAEFGRATFRWLSFADHPGVTDESAIVHAVGHFPVSDLEPSEASVASEDLAAIRARCDRHLDQASFYRLAESHNLQFGPSYRWNEEVWAGTREALARLACPPSLLAGDEYEVHPGLLDSCFQLAAATGFERGDEAFILFRIRELVLYRAPRRSEALFAHAVRHTLSPDEDVQKVSLRLFDEHGRVLCEARDIELHRASIQGFLRSLQPDSLRELCYGLDFERLEALELGEPPLRWLVTGSAGPDVVRATRALLARSRRVSELPLPAEAGSEASLGALRERLRAAVPSSEPFGLVYVTEAPAGDPASGEELWSRQAGGFSGLLSVLRAVLLEGRESDVRVRVLARGSMPEAPSSSADAFPTHAPVRGLLRTFGVEHPTADVRLVDLDGDVDDERLAAALVSAGSETEIAMRGDASYVPRLVHRQVEFVTDTLRLDPEASYLITGGTGALGLTIARFLCSRGARHLALLCRTSPAASARRDIDELVRMGAEVRLLHADVSDGEALVRALSTIDIPVRGVVHAAGVLDDALLREQTPERARRVLAPKLLGAYHLERWTRDQPLDFLLLFSSVAALFGSPGQASYAAGNAFLDALAAHRGKGTVSVWWGPWAEIGMAARQSDATRARLARLGLAPLSPSLGGELTEQLLRSAYPQVMVAGVDWQRFFAARPRVPALFRRLQESGAEAAPPARLRHELIARVRASDEEHGTLLLTDALCHMIAEAAEAPPEAIDHSRSLNELGLDSLIALNVQTRIEEELGVKVPITRFMESLTARQLARELQRELVRTPAVAAPATPLGPEPTPSRAEPPPSTPPRALEVRAVSRLVPSAKAGRCDVSLFYFSRSSGHEHPYRLLTEGARFADENDLCAVWVPERHFHEFGGPYPNPALLAAHLAAITRRVRLRAGSVVLPLHHPLRVAEEWAVVDRLSGGRVDISVVRGWGPNDFALSPGDFGDRTNVLKRRLDQVRRLWRGESLVFDNGVGEPTALGTFPRPVQPELDAWLTCTREDERFVEAGALGTNVLTALLLQSPEELERRIELYRKTRAEARHAGTGKVTLMLHTFVGEDAEEVMRTVRGPLGDYLRSSFELWRTGSVTLDSMSAAQREQMLDYALQRYTSTSSLLGTFDDCLKAARRFQRMGVDEVACLVDFGVDDELVLSHLRYLPLLQAALNGDDSETERVAE
jgi:natural product biosynthesis luciferase-like monooxygenase protein